MSARRNIGHAAAEFLAVVLEEIAGTLDRHTSRMDAVRPVAPAAATEEPGRVEFNPAAPPPAPVPDDRSCPVEVRGVPCVLPMAHTGAHVDPLGAFLAPFVTVPESDGLEAERMAERGLTDDQADATPVPFVDLGETCGAVSSTGLACDDVKGHPFAHSTDGVNVGWWDANDPEWPMPAGDSETPPPTPEPATAVPFLGETMRCPSSLPGPAYGGVQCDGTRGHRHGLHARTTGAPYLIWDDNGNVRQADLVSDAELAAGAFEPHPPAVVISRAGDRMPNVERALDACHAADERDAARAALRRTWRT